MDLRCARRTPRSLQLQQYLNFTYKTAFSHSDRAFYLRELASRCGPYGAQHSELPRATGGIKDAEAQLAREVNVTVYSDRNNEEFAQPLCALVRVDPSQS